MTLTLDTTFLFSTKIGPNGLDPKDLLQNSKALESVNKKLADGAYGFANIVKNDEIVIKCKTVFEQVKWAKYMVVLGIGGSDLGARMLQESLQIENPPMQVLFGGDTTDPQQYFDLTKAIELEQTIIVVVSKSGSTIETACGYLYFKNLYQTQFKTDWPKHFVFITDSKQGIMYEEGKKNNVLMLPVPDDVGGRYSVLSAVGLFPALAMGIDIEALIKGTNIYFKNILQQNSKDNVAWQIAIANFYFQKNKVIDTVVIMPYIYKMELFGNWFRQLWAESLGKDGKGVLPIKAVGPKDQHSQVQFYNQGKWLSSFIFIAAKHYAHDFSLVSVDDESLRYLNNKKMSDIIRAECLATRVSLAKNRRPSIYLEIDKLDAQSIGELIAVFEISVVYMGELLGINAFDQPGVEAGKDFMYGLLGKKGYEEKAREIENF